MKSEFASFEPMMPLQLEALKLDMSPAVQALDAAAARAVALAGAPAEVRAFDAGPPRSRPGTAAAA